MKRILCVLLRNKSFFYFFESKDPLFLQRKRVYRMKQGNRTKTLFDGEMRRGSVRGAASHQPLTSLSPSHFLHACFEPNISRCVFAGTRPYSCCVNGSRIVIRVPTIEDVAVAVGPLRWTMLSVVTANAASMFMHAVSCEEVPDGRCVDIKGRLACNGAWNCSPLSCSQFPDCFKPSHKILHVSKKFHTKRQSTNSWTEANPAFENEILVLLHIWIDLTVGIPNQVSWGSDSIWLWRYTALSKTSQRRVSKCLTPSLSTKM